MPTHPQARLAEAFERHRLIFVLFVFLIGLGQGSRALEYYYPRSDFGWMKVLHMVLLVSQLLALVVLFIYTGRILAGRSGVSGKRCRSMLMESYVERTSFAALAISWFVTLFMASAIGEWTEPDVLFYGPHDPASLLPATYYLELLTFVLTLSYSIAFFVLYLRSNIGGEEVEA